MWGAEGAFSEEDGGRGRWWLAVAPEGEARGIVSTWSLWTALGFQQTDPLPPGGGCNCVLWSGTQMCSNAAMRRQEMPTVRE